MNDPRPPLVVLLHGLFGRPSDFDGTVRRLPPRFSATVPLLPLGSAGAESVNQLVDRLEEELAGEGRDLVLDRLPDSRFLFIPEAGHAPMIERPSVFAFHLASFLNDLSPELRPPRRLLEEAA